MTAWRILFRGCELPNKDVFKGMGKGDWNSITQREIIPFYPMVSPLTNCILQQIHIQ